MRAVDSFAIEGREPEWIAINFVLSLALGSCQLDRGIIKLPQRPVEGGL